MGKIVWGCLLIGIGLVGGHSIFLGQADAWTAVWDGLGIMLVVYGFLQVVSKAMTTKPGEAE